MHDDHARTRDFGGQWNTSDPPPSNDTEYDDDALATALENESVRLGFTAAISIITPAEPNHDRLVLPVMPALPQPVQGVSVKDVPHSADDAGPVTRRALREAERASEAAERETAVAEVTEVARMANALAIFRFELSGPDATPAGERVGRSVQLFWLWFAANASVVSLAFGGALLNLGMSLRQTIISLVLGVALSFIPLTLGTLAGKWSGQPIMIVSRAMFGLSGNVVPAVLALLTRLFWGAVLLWIMAASTARIFVIGRIGGEFGELQLTVIAMAVFFVFALLVAFFGFALIARLHLVCAIASALVIVSLVVLTAPSLNLTTALSAGDGPVTLVVTGTVLVFSFLGLVWANSSGDLARYQRPIASGRPSMLAASFGAAVPAVVLIGYGALLAASNPAIAQGLSAAPIDTIARLLPGWYPIPLLAAVIISLFPGVVVTIYSGAFSLQAVGLRLDRMWATVIVGALAFGVAILLSVTVFNVSIVFRDIGTTIAVPVAAWTGIFAAEMIRRRRLRRRRFDAESLLARGRIYARVNWRNLGMLIAATVVGFGFTSATVTWLSWQGYFFSALGTAPTSTLGESDVGVLAALVVGLLTPFVAGVRSIRRQESRLA